MGTLIPARSTSKYLGQYSQAFDSHGIVRIFADSCQIALTSKKPDTACDRFALAVEAYHQIMSMGVATNVRRSVQRAMETLVEEFPTQVVANEALGLREKARKLKTPKKQLELLRRATSIIDGGLTANPESAVLQTASMELRAEILQSAGAVP